MKKIAVLFGGPSSESAISHITGKVCHDVIINLGYEADLIEVDQRLPYLIQDIKPDVCFNAMHGLWGEDGSVQGLLNILNIPYTHSGVPASAIAMNKLLTASILSQNGIRFAQSRAVSHEQLLKEDPYPRPYVIKPLNEGSSLNIHVISSTYPTPPFDKNNWTFKDNQRLMVEDFIPGIELTVGVIDSPQYGTRALTVSQMISKVGILDYDSKYIKNYSQRILPAPIPADIFSQAQEWALTAHQTLQCRNVSRSDFRYNPDENKLYMLEVNTHPGMTKTSMFPEQTQFCGIPFEDLIQDLVENARCD